MDDLYAPGWSDCTPDWDDDPDAGPPTRFDLRQHEMRDLRHQRAAPVALWTAHTIHAEEYL